MVEPEPAPDATANPFVDSFVDAWQAWLRAAASTGGAAGAPIEQLNRAFGAYAATFSAPLRELAAQQRELAESLEEWARLQQALADHAQSWAEQQRRIAGSLAAALAPLDAFLPPQA